jgi:tetratricopeptide (TPR) repeat protein
MSSFGFNGSKRWLKERALAVDNKKTKLLAGAEKYVLQNKIRQAIAEYLKVVQIDTGDSGILNTIGDLYLRQNDIATANKYFLQVAEGYAADSYFLKAIAVYKKILNSDPNNCDISSKVALLYGKQGLALEACAQYLRVIELLEKNGKERETREVYIKIAELDPSNIGVQQKLATLYQGEGEVARARVYWVVAARAQMKAGDFSGALESWRKAMTVASFDMEVLQGIVDCCLKLGDPASALEPLQKSLEANPEDLALRETLARTHLALGDPAAALAVAKSIFVTDESRYEGFFAVGQAFIDKGDYDQAASCLDAIIPPLLSRLEQGRIIEYFRLLLERHPRHELTLIKLASVYSATGDHDGYLETLQELTDHYLENDRSIEALEYVEKILNADPGNERCRQLHPKVFAKAYPGVEYTPPVIKEELTSAPGVGDIMPDYKAAGKEDAGETVNEVDLLLNYGLLDRALNLLRKLEAKNPCDKEVRRRMLSVYKATQKSDEAAKQCLLLAFLYRAEGQEALAGNFMIEAAQLSPEFATGVDLGQFARQQGVNNAPDSPDASDTLGDIDLSSDSMKSLFAEAMDFTEPRLDDEPVDGEALAEAMEVSPLEMRGPSPDLPDEPFPEGLAAPDAPAKPLAEQLQEVDFYLHLGFDDEACAKLDEIARTNSDHPEIRTRREQLKSRAAEAAEAKEDVPPAPEAVGGTMPPADEPVTAEDSLERQMTAAQSHRESNFGLGTFLDDQIDSAVVRREEDVAKENTERVVAQPPVAIEPPIESIVPIIALPAPPELPELPPETEAAPLALPAPAVPLASPTPLEQPPDEDDMFADLLAEARVPVDPATADASFDEHFNMGIAFSEMELKDEAIREFEAAIKSIEMRRGDPRVIQCCEQLSRCFLRKDMPMSAVRWCQTGLNLTEKSSHEDMAFRYDMGVAHALAGSADQALVCFSQVFDMDPGYRDVARRIDELKGGLQKHAV